MASSRATRAAAAARLQWDGGDYGYNGQQQQQQQQGYYPQQGGYDDYYPQQDGDYGYGSATAANGYYNDQQQDQYGYGQQQYGGAPPPRKEYSYDFYMAQDNIRAQYDRYRAQGGLLEYLRWQEMVSRCPTGGASDRATTSTTRAGATSAPPAATATIRHASCERA